MVLGLNEGRRDEALGNYVIGLIFLPSVKDTTIASQYYLYVYRITYIFRMNKCNVSVLQSANDTTLKISRDIYGQNLIASNEVLFKCHITIKSFT